MTGPAWTPGTGGGANSTLTYAAKTGAYTIDNTDCVIDCTTGVFTLTLPTAVGIVGQFFIIKNSGTGVITVDGNGSETIDGVANKILSVQYQSITVLSDGTNWKII
jgi:hypothetical protein